jgi:hypothetical protein
MISTMQDQPSIRTRLDEMSRDYWWTETQRLRSTRHDQVE